MASLAVSQVGLSVASRLNTSLDVSAHMLAMEAHHYNLTVENYYRRIGVMLGVECPSNSSEEPCSRVTRIVPPTLHNTSSLRRRETQRRGKKQPSGNGLLGEATIRAKGYPLKGIVAREVDRSGIRPPLQKANRSTEPRSAVDKAVIPNHVSLSESFSYPPRVQFCSQMLIESLLYNLGYNAIKPRFVNIPEIPEAERTKENVMTHLKLLAEKGVVYLPATCTNHNATGKCQGHPTNGGV